MSETTCDLDAMLIEHGIDPDAPLLCDNCSDPRVVNSRCRNGLCRIQRCAACNWLLLETGPVGCRCELGGPNPLAIDGHAYRRRTLRRRS